MGPEVFAKVQKNREFVDTYTGKELFNEDLITVNYTDQARITVQQSLNVRLLRYFSIFLSD